MNTIILRRQSHHYYEVIGNPTMSYRRDANLSVSPVTASIKFYIPLSHTI